jgi:gluconolactonase
MRYPFLGGLLIVSTAAVVHSQRGPSPGAIPGVLAAGSVVEVVRDGFHGLEGPTPTPDGGLFFSDVTENRTYRLDRDGSSISIWRENTQGANGLYLLPNGLLLAAEGTGRRIVVISAERRARSIVGDCADRPLRAPNDLIADDKGGVYFTDPLPRPAPDVAPKEPGNLCYIRPDGSAVLLDDQIQRPNGLTLSLDGRTLYVDDTEGEYVYAFDIRSDGTVANKRMFVKLHEPEPGSLGPRSRADGMAIDSVGRLYVATASGIQVIHPAGRYLGTIRVPAVARNLAFSGPGRHTLYLTTLQALYRVHLLVDGPLGRAK